MNFKYPSSSWLVLSPHLCPVCHYKMFTFYATLLGKKKLGEENHLKPLLNASCQLTILREPLWSPWKYLNYGWTVCILKYLISRGPFQPQPFSDSMSSKSFCIGLGFSFLIVAGRVKWILTDTQLSIQRGKIPVGSPVVSQLTREAHFLPLHAQWNSGTSWGRNSQAEV